MIVVLRGYETGLICRVLDGLQPRRVVRACANLHRNVGVAVAVEGFFQEAGKGKRGGEGKKRLRFV